MLKNACEILKQEIENNSFNISVEVIKCHADICQFNLCNSEYLTESELNYRINSSTTLTPFFVSFAINFAILFYFKNYQ